MSDLFESMQEHHAERMAIMQESGVPNPVESAAEDLFAAEVKSCMRRYYPNKGGEAAAYFEEVEKKRGIGPATRLRDAVREAWKVRRIEEAGQA